MQFSTRTNNDPSDPPDIGTIQGMCAWKEASNAVIPNPLQYGAGFRWTASFNCTQLCRDPHHKYFWTIYAWGKDAKDWVCIFDFNVIVNGQLGVHGGNMDLPASEAADWWDDIDTDDFDLSKGLKFNCKVQCVTCGNSCEVGSIVTVEGYPV